MSSDRTNQRYDGNVRLVAGCVLFRPTDASVPGSPIEVLLVQANKRRDWICPKGGWELHETAEEAALREAHEEAGVRGHIVGAPLTVTDFRSPKGNHTRLHSFLVRVDEVLDVYQEANERARQWVPLDAAMRLVERDEMQAMLQLAAARIAQGELQ